MSRFMSSPRLDVDVFELIEGDVMVFAYLKDTSLAPLEHPRWSELVKQVEATLKKPVAFVSRALKIDQRSEPLPTMPIARREIPKEVWTREGWIRLRLETENVLNPGVFSDQEYNRQRLVEKIQARAKRGPLHEQMDRLLNLFSFTGAFSVAAVAAGARSAVSVDVSQRYLDWERLNIEANFGDQPGISRRICDDARDFIRREAKRGAKYRWIVIDPPTFSRSKGKVFQVQGELESLVLQAAELLPEKTGTILVSCNDARWNAADFEKTFRGVSKKLGMKFELGLVPKEFGKEHPLKSAWIVGG